MEQTQLCQRFINFVDCKTRQLSRFQKCKKTGQISQDAGFRDTTKQPICIVESIIDDEPRDPLSLFLIIDNHTGLAEIRQLSTEDTEHVTIHRIVAVDRFNSNYKLLMQSDFISANLLRHYVEMHNTNGCKTQYKL
jgi:hypothetical protein